MFTNIKRLNNFFLNSLPTQIRLGVVPFSHNYNRNHEIILGKKDKSVRKKLRCDYRSGRMEMIRAILRSKLETLFFSSNFFISNR